MKKLLIIALLLASCAPIATPQSLLAAVSIQSLINAATVGDTITIPAGDYSAQARISISKAITLKCETARGCIIKGGSLVGGATIDGFYVRDDATTTAGLTATGTGWKIINNLVTHVCTVAINGAGANGYIGNNEIYRQRPCPGTSDADGIRFFGDGQHMKGNYIHGIFYEDSPVGANPHIDCFQTWGGASNTVIEENICDNPTANETLAGSGVNLENDTGTIIRNNYFKISGKMILYETSSTGGKAENNIFIGAEVADPPPHLYGIFGSNNYTAIGNLCWQCTTSNWLTGASSVSGNLKEVDPRMDGYCSLAYPSKGIPCGVSGPTLTPPPPSQVPPPSKTKTPTMTRTATGSPVPKTATNTPSATATPSLTHTLTVTFTPVVPTVTPTVCYSVVIGGQTLNPFCP